MTLHSTSQHSLDEKIDLYNQLFALIKGAFEETMPESLANKASENEIEEFEISYYEAVAALSAMLCDMLEDEGIESLDIEGYFNSLINNEEADDEY